MLVKEFIEELRKLPEDLPVLYEDRLANGLDMAAIDQAEILIPKKLQEEFGEKTHKCVIVHRDYDLLPLEECDEEEEKE